MNNKRVWFLPRLSGSEKPISLIKLKMVTQKKNQKKFPGALSPKPGGIGCTPIQPVRTFGGVTPKSRYGGHVEWVLLVPPPLSKVRPGEKKVRSEGDKARLRHEFP